MNDIKHNEDVKTLTGRAGQGQPTTRMAEQASLRLRERSSGWDRRPFESGSGGHVSI